MDSEPYDNFDGLEVDEVYSYDSLYNIDSSDEFEDDMQGDATVTIASKSNEVSVWQPYRGSEPEISHDVLALIDQQADEIEIKRLQEMGVITTFDKYNGQLDVALSAKMVRTWRKKTKVEVDNQGVSRSYPAWMRRSRLVGRDFNFLSYREDVYDVLICGDEQWISAELIPKLESEFKLTYTVVKRQEGGCLEFLKRSHLIEPNYESITIVSENKHATLLIERYSEIDANAA